MQTETGFRIKTKPVWTNGIWPCVVIALVHHRRVLDPQGGAVSRMRRQIFFAKNPPQKKFG